MDHTMPWFQLPFVCAETWYAKSSENHNPPDSVDLNHSSGSSFGRPVIASAPGVVVTKATTGSPGYGNWYEIDHGGGWTTRYAHLDTHIVEQGDTVRAGMQIGVTGDSGLDGVPGGGPHLHYEQRLNGVPQLASFDGIYVPSYLPYSSILYESETCKRWHVSGHFAHGTVNFDNDSSTDVFRATGAAWKARFNDSGGFDQLTMWSHRQDHLAFVDFDGNGKTDVFWPTGSAWNVRFNNGGGFQEITSWSQRVHELAFGDFDGNGETDVFWPTGSAWKVRFNNSGGFQDVTSWGQTLDQLAFVDLDGNGKTDVFWPTGSAWKVRFNNSGGFQDVTSWSQTLEDLSFGDFNGNGKTDILWCTGSTWKVRYDNSGGFQTTTSWSILPHEVSTGDHPW